MSRPVLQTLILAAVVAACDDPVPIPSDYLMVAFLTGGAERPNPVGTSASGVANFRVSAAGDTVFFDITVNGLSGNPVGLHIHGPADTTQAANVAHAFGISANTGLIAEGFFVAPTEPTISQDSLLFLMRNGLAYVNVHTVANGNGEIRGQVLRLTPI